MRNSSSPRSPNGSTHTPEDRTAQVQPKEAFDSAAAQGTVPER
jgi:hypothetical protein